MTAILRWLAPYLIGAGILAGIAVGILWYGHIRYEAGKSACQEAQRVAGLEAFKTESERLLGLSTDLQGRIDELQASKPTVIERYTRVEVEKPLPADCVRDPGRVRATNDAIDQANAARQPVPSLPPDPAR